MTYSFRPRALAVALAAILCLLLLPACDDRASSHPEGKESAEADYERGPHRGRMLRAGDLALELTIYEEGPEPLFHIYPYVKGKALDPAQARVAVQLTRLGGRVEHFAFAREGAYLASPDVVHEPHSFDVKVTATYAEKSHSWSFASYEGRTTISADRAGSMGINVETAGPAVLDETLDFTGRIALAPEGRSEVRAWYPGRIVEMTRSLGQPVKRGDVLARIEATESLRTYSIPAPISGVVAERNANVGDVASSQPLYTLVDASKLHAEFFIYPRDAERVRVGQPVEVRSLAGDKRLSSTIAALLPTAQAASQTVVAHAELDNPQGVWHPGMAVEVVAVVGSRQVPLAVRTRALQRFRDFTVVYVRVGDTYEVRMLKLGQRTPEWTEVLGGLEPGAEYVSDKAFLVRADVEKSGASHDH